MKLAIEPLSKFSNIQIASKAFLNNLKNNLKLNKKCNFSSHYLPFYDIGLFATTNKGIFNKPYILRLDGIYIDEFNKIKNTNIENNKIFESIEKSSGVIFNSNYSKNIVEKFYKKILKPNEIITNGINQKLFTPYGEDMRSKLGIKDDEVVLLTCALWRRHKRLKETIKLFKEIQKRRKENFKLIVIGPKNNIENEKDVIFSGFINNSDLPKWYRSANIYVHLCWIEANSNSQCEAISCGLPVICCNNGGNYETVKNLNAGTVSYCDEDIGLNKVNLYNPPEPNYEILIDDFNNLMKSKNDFKSNPLIKNLDLNIISEKYFDFINKIYQKVKK